MIKFSEEKKESLERFLETHQITVEVRKRFDPRLPTFSAASNAVEIQNGSLLVGRFGSGESQEEALQDLARVWSNQHLVIDAFKRSRREIFAPTLYFNGAAAYK